MKKNRLQRVNSLLQEVLSEVIRLEVRNPHISEFLSITHVETSADLQHAKVFISVIGDDKVRAETIEGLQQSAKFIALHGSKKVTMRYFPELIFKLDTSVDEHMKIEKILSELEQERQSRHDHP